MVIEIQGVENGELAVPVNNTLMSHMAFLAAYTRPCVLITIHVKFMYNNWLNKVYHFSYVYDTDH